VHSFWNKVQKTDTCWEWIGSKNNGGYGKFWFKRKCINSHRFAWLLTYGDIPKGNYVLHHCDNPSCVRPDHLFLGSQRDNMQDMLLKGRGVWGRTSLLGETNPRAKLISDDVLTIRRLFSDGMSQTDIAKQYGMSVMAIHNIVRYKTWKHV